MFVCFRSFVCVFVVFVSFFGIQLNHEQAMQDLGKKSGKDKADLEAQIAELKVAVGLAHLRISL